MDLTNANRINLRYNCSQVQNYTFVAARYIISLLCPAYRGIFIVFSGRSVTEFCVGYFVAVGLAA